MSPRNWLILALIVIAAILVLRALSRSKPIPESPPMRTASHKQIERETAEIQGGKRAWWKDVLEAIGWVVACLLIAGLVVPK